MSRRLRAPYIRVEYRAPGDERATSIGYELNQAGNAPVKDWFERLSQDMVDMVKAYREARRKAKEET